MFLYITTFLSYASLNVINAQVALFISLAIAVFTCFIAEHVKSETIMTLGNIGGLVAPLFYTYANDITDFSMIIIMM